MPDLGPVAEALAPVVSEIVGPILKVLLKTAAGMIFLTLLVAGVSYEVAADGNWKHGLAGMALGLVTCGICGGLLTAKRVALSAVKAAIQKARLGKKMLALVFERMLAVNAKDNFMERGGSVAKTVERLPLAQAEARLKSVVDSLVDAPEAGGGFRGWIKRSVQEALVRRVEAVTLAEFRESGAGEGGVDLAVTHHKLGDLVDNKIVAGIDAAMLKVTALFVALACGVSLLGSMLIRGL
jgi:hypothetical protein